MKPVIASLVVGLLLANASDISSCGPFLPYAVFTGKRGPDSEQKFFAGQLGILRPTFERRYLVIAYRVLTGESLTPPQQRDVTNLERLRTPDLDEQVNQWTAAAHDGVKVEPYRRDAAYEFSLVCGVDAFVTARKTLEARIHDAGAGSSEVKDWLYAQEQVFANCSGGQTSRTPRRRAAVHE